MELKVVEVNKNELSLLCELVDLERQAFGGGGLNEWTLPIVIKYGKVFALKKGDEVCGLAEFIRDWDNPADIFLVGFFVKESYREKSFGKHFLGAVLDKLKKGKVNNIFLTVAPDNRAALKLYEQFGFRETAFLKDEYGRGRHRRVMKLELGA